MGIIMINRITVFTLFSAFCIIYGSSLQSDDADTRQTIVTLSTKVESKQVPLNRILKFIVQIAWEGDIDLINIGELEEPVLTNFEIVGTSSANRVAGTAGGKRAVKEITYQLMPKSPGMGYIESTGLSYEDLRTGKTHHLLTQRLSAEVISPVPEKGQSRIPWIWIGPIFLCVFVMFGIILLRVRKRSGENDVESVTRIIEEAYIDELKKMSI